MLVNDFTKEELITLKNGVEYLSDRTSLSLQYIDKCNTIVNKLIPLIDNYCEHLVQEAIQHCNVCSVSEYRCLGCLTVSYEGLK